MYKIINKKKLAATIAADAIGKIIFLPKLLSGKSRENMDDGIRDILVIRTAYIGDVVMTMPILKPLKEKFPGSRISFLTSTPAGEVLKNNPYLDDVITYDPFWFYPTEKKKYLEFIKGLKKRSFDLVIESRGDIRELLFLVWPLKARFKLSYDFGGGGYLLTDIVPYHGLKHKVEYHFDMIRYLGCDIGDLDWGVYLTEGEKNKVREILEKNSIRKPFISVHPGARIPLKRWMADRYAKLCDRLIEDYGLPLIMLGAKGERNIVDEILREMRHRPTDLVGALTLRELSGILSESALFICNDSSPMHIAASMKTPTVAIFGPSKSVETAPYGNVNRIVEKDYPCRCHCDESSCRNKRFHGCMRDIEVEDVLSAVGEITKELRL